MAHLSAELEVFRDICNLLPYLNEEKKRIYCRLDEIYVIEEGVSSPSISKISKTVSPVYRYMTHYYEEKEVLVDELSYYAKAEEWIESILNDVEARFRELIEDIYIYRLTSFQKAGPYYGYVPNYLRDLVTTQIRKAVHENPPPLQVREIVAANVDRLYKRRIKHPPEE